MAIRSTSGTGVVVSLVVFVLCTVFLLILSIVFYAGKSDALQNAAAAKGTLARFVSADLQNRDQIKAILGDVNPAQGESVVRYLLKQRGDVMGYLSGDPDAELETVKGDFSSKYAVSEDDSIRTVLHAYARQVRTQQAELDGAKTRVTDGEERIAQFEARIEQIQEDHRRTLDAAHGQINTFGQETLPPGEGFDLHIATYTLIGDPGTEGVNTLVCPCDEIGYAPPPLLAVVGGFSFLVDAECGEIRILASPFLRGDCNGDVSYDIADPIFMANNRSEGGL